MPETSAHQLVIQPRFGTTARALVVDGHTTARSILVSQLRALGVGHVTQCARASEARQHLAAREFDVVLCEVRLGDGSLGQDLIDEARRRQLLPLATVVMMLSSNATYDVVAEVAESAVDGFLVKPYSPGDLEDRLMRAFVRKEALKDIYTAIEDGRWDDGLRECEARFLARGTYWTYAARLGAELAIRQGRLPLASAMYEAVLEDKAVPWARLGVARVLDAGDRRAEATSTIRDLLAAEPSYADAYDVLGKIYAEQGEYAAAIEAYGNAARITPGSLVRQQKYGILAWYAGEHAVARAALRRALEIGAESPAFDPQTLLLLAMSHYRERDAGGLTDIAQRLAQALERPGSGPEAEALQTRLRRFSRMLRAMQALLRGDHDTAEVELAQTADELARPNFDVEAAVNLLTVLAMIHAAGTPMTAGPRWVRSAAMRFCTSRHVSEVLARACDEAGGYAKLVRAAHAEIGETTRLALSEALAGRPRQAVEQLLNAAGATLNARLLEVASATLERHRARIPEHDALRERCDALRERCGAGTRPLLAPEDPDRPSGGMALAARARPEPAAPRRKATAAAA